MSANGPANPNAPRPSRLMRFFPRNWISEAGMTLALVSIGNIVIFTIIDVIALKPNPYVSILAYMVSPGFLLFSFVLMGVGYWRARRAVAVAPYPRIDLNDPRQRGAILGFLVFLVVFVLISAAGSYKAY